MKKVLANPCTSEFLFLAPLTPIPGLQRPKIGIIGAKVALWHIIGTHIEWKTSFLSCLAQLREDGGANLVSHLLWHPNYFFFKGLMRVIRKTEMREINVCCATVAQNFLLIFSLLKISRKLHQKHSLLKEKRKSVSLNGNNHVFILPMCTIWHHRVHDTTYLC